MAYSKPGGRQWSVPMNSTVTPTQPKFFPEDFKAHFLDGIGRNAAEVDGDDAKVGGLLRKAAHQPDVAAHQPDVARPGLDAMAGSALDEIRPSLGKRASRGLVRFLIVFSIGVCTTLAWQWYGDAARAMIATSWPQLASLAPETASVPQAAPEQTAAAPQATASPSATAQGGFGAAETGVTAAQGYTSRARQLAAKCGPTGRQPATDRRHDRQAGHAKACIASSARSCPST
jgi:hypothetical protein